MGFFRKFCEYVDFDLEGFGWGLGIGMFGFVGL